ncbi:MAG: hypothetical protein JW880_05540 [Candidatus Thermoplasmatota archaeon]|nr:hypothetical protein [Candidatus Thermoplasmatota archaeon]
MRGRLIAAATVAALSLLCAGMPSEGAIGASQADLSWTVMVYMANDVSNPLPWEDNINSMEAAAQAQGISVVALVDNPGDGDSVLLKVEHDTSGTGGDTIVSTEIDDEGAVIPMTREVNTADHSTLAAFIDFSANEYPADRLVLILWGHGAGWQGLCPDKSDLLTLPELAEALDDATTSLGRRIDMVVVDACAQSTMEMLAELRPYAAFFVGAQNDVPYQGLPYGEILEILSTSPGQSVEDFASTIVSQYVEYAWFVSPYSATMAAFDLDRLDTALSLLDSLSLQGIKYNSIFHDVINEALMSAEFYDTEWYVDLVDLMTLIHASDLPLEMRMLALQTAVSFREATVAFEKFDHPDPYDGVGVARANGAVIYAPATSYYEASYSSLMLSAETNWNEFGSLARLVTSTEQRVPGPSISYADSDEDGLLDTAYLEWEEDYPLVEAWIYARLPNGLVFETSLNSSSSNISINGFMGNLVIGASAVDMDGEAVSYVTLNATLYGHVRLEVFVRLEGELVSDRYDVQVVSSTHTSYAMPEGDALVMTLIVPAQASIGEMVFLRVMNGQDLLLTSRFVIVGQDSTMTIDLYGQDEEPQLDDLALLSFSLLPAVLLGIFTVMLYIDYKRARKKA